VKWQRAANIRARRNIAIAKKEGWKGFTASGNWWHDQKKFAAARKAGLRQVALRKRHIE